MEPAASRIIEQSFDELKRTVGRHHAHLSAADGTGQVEPAAGPCVHPECSQNRRLKSALARTILVLEETRKSFKSKRLGALRKDLLRVLAEEA